jgi:hypothetical protein
LRTFSRVFIAFVAENPNLSVFLLGFALFCGSLAVYSLAVAGVVSGAILMLAAVYPYLMTRKG